MFQVEPIQCGIIESVPKGVMTYLVDQDVTLDIPVLSFLVTGTDPGDQRTVLVDTGLEAPTDGTVAGRSVRGGGPEPIRAALRERDLTPADVDVVVLSHLHHDHTGNNHLFPQAEFVVQRVEIESARNPLPFLERVYFEEHLSQLTDHELTVIDGDYRLFDGIELVSTPGHSDGMQTIIVETAVDPVAIVTDLADCRHNLEPSLEQILDAHGNEVDVTSLDVEYIPPGIHLNVSDCYRSIRRIKGRVAPNGHLLGGHVPELVGRTFP